MCVYDNMVLDVVDGDSGGGGSAVAILSRLQVSRGGGALMLLQYELSSSLE